MDVISIGVGAAPALGLMWYFDRLDAKRPEPRSIVRRVAFTGALAVLPCAWAEGSAMDWVRQLPLWAVPLYIGLLAGIVEELAKVLCLRGWVWTQPAFDERMDGIVYATRAALGFALVENILYLAGQKTAGAFLVVAVVRSVLAVPGHAIWGGIMGYFAARRRFDNRGPGAAGGLLIAAAMHAAYDAAILWAVLAWGRLELVIPLLSVPVLLVAGGALWLRSLARSALRDDDAAAARAAATAVPSLPELPVQAATG